MNADQAPDQRATPIAIIGMACIFPQAADLQAFWNNILGGVDAVGDPVESWDAARYLGSGRIKTQAGGYLKDLFRFDPREFGIMPNSMDGGEPDQFLALRVARDALADAGYLRPDADHTDTGVILGHSTYLHRGQVTVIQTDIVIDQTLELVKAALPHLDADALGELRALLAKKLPPMNADTAPGLVPNVMTGRIANRLNLRGPNYLVDAACSSSLLAVGAAIDELRAGRSRMMLAGGVNASLPADVTTIFTQLGALSGRGKVRPFDAASDGTLLGEGLGVVVLKRLQDALADEDRVYAVLRGVGQSSDGRGTGLLAPSHAGESLAMRRAYVASGVDPATVGLVEAHGTGIPLGDKTEIASLKTVFGERTTPIGVKALGSVKSMISHCIPAAGVASLIKMALALHHRVLPPTLCDQVNPELGVDQTPFYVNTRAAPWIARLGRPRRAAVNAFGFGGTNSHAIVEQAPAQARRPGRLTAWPVELCVLSAPTAEALVAKLGALAQALARPTTWRLAEVAQALARTDRAEEHRIALVAKDVPGLAKGVEQALKRLREAGGRDGAWSTRSGAAYAGRRVQGALAFLFPGEGSQYPEMFADLAQCFDKMQEWLDFWHGLYDLPLGHTRTDIVFPTCEVGDERRKKLEQRLHDMDVGSESVFIGGMAMHELLVSLGVQPDVMLGHSSGESAALGASGANPAVTPEARAACISEHYAVYEELLASGKIPTGALLAVGALPPDTVEREVAGASDVVVAMDNCGNQMVLYGTHEGIAGIQKRLSDLGGICLPLPFDRGYHTPAFSDASAAFLGYYKSVRLGKPQVPLYSCASVGRFPDQPAAVRKLAAAQWSQRVRFRETVLKMHADGVRMFVEVGPSANLTAFVNDILIDREFLAVPTNVRRKGGLEQLLSALGQLYVAGRGPEMQRLFAGRAIAEADLAAGPPAPRGTLLDNTMPMVRLDGADRESVRRLAASAAPSVARPDDSPQPGTAGEAPPQILPVHAGGRERVMAEYFELMRDFLDGTQSVVEAWPGDALPGGSRPAAQPAWLSSHANDSATPLLDEIVEHDAGHVLARCSVSLLNDNFIRDHVLSGPVSEADAALFGLSCVPFTVSLEVMAQACALLAGGRALRVVENVKALDWVALDDGALTFDVRADAVDGVPGRFVASVATQRGPVLTAEFGFDAAWQLQPLADLREPRESCLNSPHLYATGMFHGPLFQSMRYVRAWDDTGIDVELSDASLQDFFAPGHTPRLVTNPVLLDAMGQVVACWLVQYVGTDFHAFPSTIERIELYEPNPAGRDGIVMRMRQHPVEAGATDVAAQRLWQFECVDGAGTVLMRGSGLVNLFFRVPAVYHEVRTDPLTGWLGVPLEALAQDGVKLWRVPLLGEDLCSQSGGICLRILAHVLLSPAERDEWRALQGRLRRRREWLFGRAALKEAVRSWIFELTGRLLYPSDIVVVQDEHGAPRVEGWWAGRLVAAPRVSLAHDDEACVAAVSSPDRPVGVDTEGLGRLKDPALIAQTFSPGEHELLAGLQGPDFEERVLRLWCAKEAVAKCLGTGLGGDPGAFEVVSSDADCALLLVRHEAEWTEARVTRRGGTIIAAAALPEGSPEVHE